MVNLKYFVTFGRNISGTQGYFLLAMSNVEWQRILLVSNE